LLPFHLFTHPATSPLYTLSLHDALPISVMSDPPAVGGEHVTGVVKAPRLLLRDRTGNEIDAVLRGHLRQPPGQFPPVRQLPQPGKEKAHVPHFRKNHHIGTLFLHRPPDFFADALPVFLRPAGDDIRLQERNPHALPPLPKHRRPLVANNDDSSNFTDNIIFSLRNLFKRTRPHLIPAGRKALPRRPPPPGRFHTRGKKADRAETS